MNHILPSDLFVDEIKETAVFLGSLFLGKTTQSFSGLGVCTSPLPFCVLPV